MITLEEVILDHFEEISFDLRKFIEEHFEIFLKDDQDKVLEFIADVETQDYEFNLEILDENRDLFELHLKRNGMIYDSLELTIYGLI